MKRKIIMFHIFFMCLSKIGIGQIDSTLSKLLLINYNTYSGKPVDSLVKILPQNFSRMNVSFSHSANYGNVLQVTYRNGVIVRIRVNQFNYMNPILNPSRPVSGQWKVSLFKKEIIAYTVIYQNNICYSGCQYDPVQISKS